MATTPTEAGSTLATDSNGRNGAETHDIATDVVELNLRDPQFMATVYDTYNALREQGRVSKVKFSSGQDDQQESASPRDRFFNQ